MHKHRDEIVRWANSKEGTSVWYKPMGYSDWFLSDSKGISWDKDTLYICNDNWANLRKARADGKQLQRISNTGEWLDTKLASQPSHSTEKWRIKPRIELEWQFIKQDGMGGYCFTNYMTELQARGHQQDLVKYEPSERIKKDC